MKKIDFHIHTIPTVSDKSFEFCIDSFKRYVDTCKLDAVAITNHDLFNKEQFFDIKEKLGIKVFPGIEINLEYGHILIITDEYDVDDFQIKSNIVRSKIIKATDSITFEELQQIFGDLKKYLIIPHYDKKPQIYGSTLEKLKPFISSGEVDSAKKFIRNIKDNLKLTPVLFSDTRIRKEMGSFAPRQTYIDCGDLSLDSIKLCLGDKTKVFLSKDNGNSLWQILENGQKISTSLNIVIGQRSSGKTHFLEDVKKSIKRTKYIPQFSLVQGKDDDESFRTEIESKRGIVVDEYLSGIKKMLDEVSKINLDSNSRSINEYLESLKQSAIDFQNQDIFSKCKLFDEELYAISSNKNISNLIESIKTIIENTEYSEIINKHVSIVALKSLLIDLIETSRLENLETKKKNYANEIIKDIKDGLNLQTSATSILEIDLYELIIESKKIEKFNEIIKNLQKKSVIHTENVQGFNIIASKEEFKNATELGNTLRRRSQFSSAYSKYKFPYEYLNALKELDSISNSDFYKLFVKINYEILNKDGYPVSGGERSEFRLLQEIKDAQNYDILLIDEPESSFDNIFLNSEVNQLIKSIAQTMPVIIVTHNSTIGASIGANYILHTSKEKISSKIIYKVYSGYIGDKKLHALDGSFIESHSSILNSLEAGLVAYDKRNKDYDLIKN